MITLLEFSSIHIDVIHVIFLVILLASLSGFIWLIYRFLHKHRSTEIVHEEIPLKVISDSKSCILAIKELLSHSPMVVGIDCEWKSSTDGGNKISLLQIADNHLILLIRLHLISPIPMELISFLNNIQIIKCGVGIYGDKKKLFNDYNINISGCIDLNDITHNNNYLSLSKLSQFILKKEMKYKQSNIDHSKWECKQLSKQQILYAADDALIGYLLFDEIMKRYYIEQITNGESYLEICYGKLDRCSNKIKMKSKNTSNYRNKLPKWSRRLTYKRYGYAAKILDEDGEVLTLCSANLKRYLLQNGMAKTVKNVDKYFWDKTKHVSGHNHYVIELINRADTVDIENNNINDYCRSINVKELECYICGANKDLTRCFLIPKNYPKFINCAKKIHYAVPICLHKCQQKVFKWKYLFEQKLMNKYKLMDDINTEQRKLEKQLRIYALTLQKKRKRYQVSVEIQNKWIQQILLYFNVPDKECIRIKDCHINKEMHIDWFNVNDYDYIIIKQYINRLTLKGKINKEIDDVLLRLYQIFRGKEIEFIEMWRKDFMVTFEPKCHNHKFNTFQIFCTNFEWQS